MSHERDFLAKIDEQRASRGFLSVSQLLDLAKGNTVLDPFSILISISVVFGENNTFYPNVILEAQDGGTLSMGDGNVLYPNTLMVAEKGSVTIGSNNQFGDGGCSIKANMSDVKITVGDNGRYINGAQVIGKTTLGSGSQIIGPVTAQNVTLEEGGDYRSSDPELRAGVLKGSGLARGIVVSQGKVLNGSGTFKQEDMEDQSKYHPKKG